MIEVKKVTKKYGKKDNVFTALHNINVKIPDGSSIAIIGKSGSGKSTLMHILALLDKPTDGRVIVDSRDTTDMKSYELDKIRNEKFGFVFQQFFLNANDSVLNNVILPLKIAGVPARERKKRALSALAAVEMTDKVKNKASELSGGQKQRVCIARALVCNPSVIFADEPTGNLDTATGEIVEKLLFGLHKDKGITLIIVTHDSDLATKCEQQLYMRDGKLVSKKEVRL
ncbi:ABC transporter ATP-binding protein [Candidatus Saccharibacteria bacterium]|nr:ABC transporter ATP-binding protein [Candidatus Saccharibacteria bacterium]